MTSGPPATDAARQWSGWGTALKPAMEPITVARRPLEGTVAANVLEHGCGGLNIDGCRVGTEPSPSAAMRKSGRVPSSCKPGEYGDTIQNRITPERWQQERPGEQLGRWPANLIHSGEDEVVGLFPVTTSGGGIRKYNGSGFLDDRPSQHGKVWNGTTEGDTGSAARFFYCAKASKKDRDEGCEGLVAGRGGALNMRTDSHSQSNGMDTGPRRNHHPTVKPTDLMRYLVRLVTPPGGIVLDPFMGSGSTGKAAILEGFRFIGIEQSEEFAKIAVARLGGAR